MFEGRTPFSHPPFEQEASLRAPRAIRIHESRATGKTQRRSGTTQLFPSSSDSRGPATHFTCRTATIEHVPPNPIAEPDPRTSWHEGPLKSGMVQKYQFLGKTLCRRRPRELEIVTPCIQALFFTKGCRKGAKSARAGSLPPLRSLSPSCALWTRRTTYCDKSARPRGPPREDRSF
jgi:hypothetical protein